MADEDVKETGAAKPEADTTQTTPSSADPAPSASPEKPAKKAAKKAAKKKAAAKKVVAKKATRKKKTPAREAPITAPPAVAVAGTKPVEAPPAVAVAATKPLEAPPVSSAPVEPVWDDDEGAGFTTYLAEWGPIILLVFLVLVLDAPEGDDAPVGASGMREATPSGGDPAATQVVTLPAAGSSQPQTPPPDPAGSLGGTPTLPRSVQGMPSLNPIDQEPGAYYWGPASQGPEVDKQAGDAWPDDAPGAVYWSPLGEGTVEGVSTTGQ